ncbi:MAG TPA: SIS domain-containing protein [Terriglobales bacterium]|nr:SIS domain-containing protein [Terriglobales bacterium]
MTSQQTENLGDMAAAASREIAEVIAKVDEAAADRFVDAIAGARRIALHGVGREGLMMKGFAMRLFHLGLDAHVVGDMTTPPLGSGDLLIVSAGPGQFATISAFLEVARKAGARTACVTAQPDGATSKAADIVFHLPAQTMANDQRGANDQAGKLSILPPLSILPMGSLFEGVQYVIFELLILRLRDKLGRTADFMRANHTNLE